MTNKITILFLSLTLSFIPNLSYSEERYCIDTDGFILPIFNNDKCINEDDIKLYIDSKLSKLKYHYELDDMPEKSKLLNDVNNATLAMEKRLERIKIIQT